MRHILSLRNIFFCAALLASLFYSPLAFADEKLPRSYPDLCPASQELAQYWEASVIKAADLKNVMPFLDVPYPIRDPLEARQRFLNLYKPGSPIEPIRALFEPYKDRFYERTLKYGPNQLYRLQPNFSRLAALWWADLRPYFIDIETYTVVIEENCGSLTPWMIAVHSHNNKLYDIDILRTYDDVDFSKRGIPFRFQDFDRAVFNSETVSRAMLSYVRHIKQPNETEIAALERMLSELGVETDVKRNHKLVPDHYSVFYGYTPTYRDVSRRTTFNIWSIYTKIDTASGKIILLSLMAPY